MSTSRNGSENQYHIKPRRSKWLVGAIAGIGSLGLGAAFLTGYYTRGSKNFGEFNALYAELISTKQELLEARANAVQRDSREQKEDRLRETDTVALEALFMNTGTELLRAIEVDLEDKIREARKQYDHQFQQAEDEKEIPDLKEIMLRRYTSETLKERIKHARVIVDAGLYVDQQGDLIGVNTEKQTEEVRVRGLDILGESTDISFPLVLKTRDQHYIAFQRWGMHLLDPKGKLLIADARHLLRDKEGIYEVVGGKTRKVNSVNLELYGQVVSGHHFIQNMDMGYSAIAHLLLQQPRIFFDKENIDALSKAYRDLFDLALSQKFERRGDGLYARVRNREIK